MIVEPSPFGRISPVERFVLAVDSIAADRSVGCVGVHCARLTTESTDTVRGIRIVNGASVQLGGALIITYTGQERCSL